MLRRSLGVSETALTDDTVKPAPPVDPELPSDIHESSQFEMEMEEIDEEGNVIHDEL